MAETPDILGAVHTGWLSISSGDDTIVGCNAVAAQLLASDPARLIGTQWRETLAGVDCEEQLARALVDGRKTPLSPFMLGRGAAGDIILSGLVLPGPDCLVLLWPLLDGQTLGLPEDLGPGDAVVALGVERVSPAGRNPRDVMDDIRASLNGILRRADHVSQAVENTVVLVLKDLDLDAALDMSRAILSHVNGLPTLARQNVPGVRLGIGLAMADPVKSPLEILLAANNALLCLRHREDIGRIRVAAEGDASYLADLAADPYALFSNSPGLRFERAGATRGPRANGPLLAARPLETGIDGYVVDNMEGAVDQAIFLAGLDIPIAIIGPAGTGKLYIARIVQQQSNSGGDALVALDCKEFRSRADANKRIAAALSASAGKTLVFKSPHLMSVEAQEKLARQLRSRTLADANPPEYLPKNQLIALFPDDLEILVRKGRLAAELASVFAGYPIHVPPIRDRKQAVLRWAHKILAQEGEVRQRDLKGFTPDAEQAMLLHDWPGNITEMRQCIVDALERSDKEWITPVDLGLFKGINVEGAPRKAQSQPFLSAFEQGGSDSDDTYVPTTLESLDVALGQAVNNLVAARDIRPLGTWAEDDMVLAALERYRGNPGKAAAMLHTRSRNISRWLPKIEDRDEARNGHPQWQECRRLVREWVRESPLGETSPLETLQALLLAHVQRQAGATSVAERARLLGVSVPTYHKRLKSSAAAEQQ